MIGRAIILTSLGIVAACGASPEVQHAPLDPNEGVDEPGPSRNAVSCAEGRKHVELAGREFCVGQPRVLALVDFSLSGFSVGDSTRGCDSLKAFVTDFGKAHLVGTVVSWIGCRQSVAVSKEYLSSFTLTKSGKSYPFAFVAGFRKSLPGDLVESAYVRVCAAGDATVAARCKEAYVSGEVPSDVLRIYPEPSEALVSFYPTLLAFLGR